MIYAIILLIIIIVILLSYLCLLQAQIRRVNYMLEKRTMEHSRQYINLDMINSELNKLVKNINLCLKAEESIRLGTVREEKKFRELIANISHDLRTPLTAAKGYLQLLQKEKLTKEQQDKLEISVKHTNELGLMVEHFFEYAYLLNNEPDIHIERFNVTNLVTECLIGSVTMFEEKGLDVVYEEPAPIYINADKEMTTRIIRNLIRNCAEHSTETVTVKLERGNMCSLTFINPINNMDLIESDRIFERFYTGDSSRKHSTGLGLSIVKILAEKMGGNVGCVVEGDLLNVLVRFPLAK
ncbi:sensor histidine kinase [Anaeromicropila herbilytica]|uniref:histidine kinase n=1 Tax=Anaeromicropila herbilytica TaxID=2785025 RepID=A0A7R7EI70_9FIRM|nr:HAMP domain-containing sensor histidine kinase [Anaeromicropila herbilytica]BCN28907.1 two-component sensor histidine kinase [Anaeromicropila herbilytica]